MYEDVCEESGFDSFIYKNGILFCKKKLKGEQYCKIEEGQSSQGNEVVRVTNECEVRE